MSKRTIVEVALTVVAKGIVIVFKISVMAFFLGVTYSVLYDAIDCLRLDSVQK